MNFAMTATYIVLAYISNHELSKLPETRLEDYQEMQEDTEYFVQPYISFQQISD